MVCNFYLQHSYMVYIFWKKNNFWLDMYIIFILFFENMFIKKQNKTSVTITIEKNILLTAVNFICPKVHVHVSQTRYTWNRGEQVILGWGLNETWTIHNSIWSIVHHIVKIYPLCSPKCHMKYRASLMGLHYYYLISQNYVLGDEILTHLQIHSHTINQTLSCHLSQVGVLLVLAWVGVLSSDSVLSHISYVNACTLFDGLDADIRVHLLLIVSLTSVNGRTVSTQTKKRAQSVILMGPRPIQVPVLGCIDGSWEGGTAGLGSTPWYSGLQYCVSAIKACVMENIKKTTQMGTSKFFLTGSHQGPWQFTEKFQISLGLPSVPIESGIT